MSIITLGYHNSVQESKQHLKYTILHKQHALIIIPFEIFLFFLGGGDATLPHGVCGEQRTACRNRFSPFFIWVPGI